MESYVKIKDLSFTFHFCFFSRDTMIKLWDLNTCTEFKTLSGHTENITAVFIIDSKSAKYICTFDFSL